MDEKTEDLEIFRLKQQIINDVSDYNHRLNKLKKIRSTRLGMSEIGRDDYRFLTLYEK